MTNVSIFIVISTIFVLLGALALVTRNETISTRHRVTQLFFVFIAIGGLIGMEGNYKLGIAVSVLASAAYAVRWRRFQKDRRFFHERGMSVPEYKKP